jgi:uncharacterized protein YukE
MNEMQEVQTYLDDAARTIGVTKNTMELADIQAADYDEILRECQSNISWIEKDLEKVRQYLYPEKYAVIH